MEMKNSRNEEFSTPQKNRSGFLSAAEAFATPASVFHSKFGSNMATPCHLRASQIIEHDSNAPNLQLMSTEEIPTLKTEVTIREIVDNVNKAFLAQIGRAHV